MFLLLLFLAVTGGCTTARVTTTPRTAIEQALLSKSAEGTLDQMDFSSLAGHRFFIQEDKFDAVDSKYVLLSLRERLLKASMEAAPSADKADIIVYPRVAAAGIDDYEFLFGIPSIGIPVPGNAMSGSLKTPELALFKINRQWGRNRMAVHSEKATSGTLVLDTPVFGNETYYTRYTILIFFGFRLTNLGKPF